MRPPASLTFLPYLEGLRGIAALYVVLFHARNELIRDRPRSFDLIPFHGTFLSYGHYSVAIFICISGYVLTLPVVKHGSLRGGAIGFFKRRARRLLPAYYVALAISIPLALFNEHIEGVGFSLRTFAAQVATHVFLVHDFFTNDRIIHGLNGALWTIPVEFHIYVVFALVLLPLLFRFGVTTMIAVAFLLGLVPELIGIAHHHADFFRLGKSCFWFLGLFAFGSAAALASRRDGLAERIPWGPAATALAIAAVAALIIFGPSSSNQTLESGLDSLLGLATAATFIYVAQGEARGQSPLFARFLAARPCVALGTFSYSLYLIHEPLIRAVTHGLARARLSDAALIAVVYGALVPAVIALAFVFSLAFERPFVSTYRRRADAQIIAGELLPKAPVAAR